MNGMKLTNDSANKITEKIYELKEAMESLDIILSKICYNVVADHTEKRTNSNK